MIIILDGSPCNTHIFGVEDEEISSFSHVQQHHSGFCQQSDGNAPESERVVKECSVKSFEKAHSGRANSPDRNRIVMMSVEDCETEPGTMF